MRRWQSIADIVSVFVKEGYPGHALAALAILMTTGIPIFLAVYVLRGSLSTLLG